MSILITAYIVIWLAIFLFIIRLHREQRRLSRAMETLQTQWHAGKEP